MGHKGHWGEYTGNAKWSRDHAHTRVTSKNYDDAVKDDAAHIDYLKRDINYDNKHGHSDQNMTAEEKHISKLAGDMKYDKEHHGSPAHNAASGYEHGEHPLKGKVLKDHIKNDPYHKRRGGDNNNPIKNIVGAATDAADKARTIANQSLVKGFAETAGQVAPQIKNMESKKQLLNEKLKEQEK